MFMTLDPDKHTSRFIMQTAEYLKSKNIKDCYELRIFIMKTSSTEYTGSMYIEVDKKRIELIKSDHPTPINMVKTKIKYLSNVARYLEEKNIAECYELRVFIIKKSNEEGYTDTIRVTADKKTIGEDFRVPYNSSTTLENINYGKN
jgi:hypothetical protein